MSWNKSEAEKRYDTLIARLEEIEAEVAKERGLHVSDIYITDPMVDAENTADSTDWRTGEPLVEDTDAWWEMMYAQAVFAAAGRMEQMELHLNDYYTKPVMEEI